MNKAIPETRHLVLAVNDDPASDLALYAWLAERGVAVLRAYSTEHALRLLTRARVQLVISDLARQEGQILNKTAGIALAQAIRALGCDAPMVIFTNDKSPQIKTLALEAGANHVTEHGDALLEWLRNQGI
ncbi:response regulator [Thiohalocapsa marina]|uniref:Response regulator n=1 Tax=Thiohalocapsa marina TaxID=424902 RepID=A0A5M8FM75_9GAMM|nr:response regulator [Thiohalocapsa marina]KAA6184231.1 response regulator [Thiohalocapsa marina]